MVRGEREGKTRKQNELGKRLIPRMRRAGIGLGDRDKGSKINEAMGEHMGGRYMREKRSETRLK